MESLYLCFGWVCVMPTYLRYVAAADKSLQHAIVLPVHESKQRHRGTRLTCAGDRHTTGVSVLCNFPILPGSRGLGSCHR